MIFKANIGGLVLPRNPRDLDHGNGLSEAWRVSIALACAFEIRRLLGDGTC